MTLEDCLPPYLKGPATTITRIAAGLSGAGVYRVEASGKVFVLKVAAAYENDADWQRAVAIQQLAAAAGLAPRIVHVDAPRRAVLTDFIVDHSFIAFYRDPRSHDAALTLLGRTVRRLHALPVPADAPALQPRALLSQFRDGLRTDFALPDFASAAIDRVLAEEPPQSERAAVLGHNDLNPSNLVYDGAAILMLDFATAGPMEPSYDLAVLAVFFRMDEDTCRRLLAAYDDGPVATLPSHFCYSRRLVAAFTGAMQLFLARQLQHAGATGGESLATTLPLGEFYQRLQAGALKLGTADGQWAFGLALLKESLLL